ncbi:A/G-specific adenine glycosylase [Vibrio gazogenes]|uniref:Adenine DNA glycosylase n=1 Tax=Vibrio gazogenes DSM 21264 = NBRC 103151 TaxID=1123492 RepID=A0A1M5A3A7_VIBGA|nr:A/G-specific adenine glycosylase [Vibrio gazogenes]USP13368.1 A/G-specific adenine glycosylase [Vibrio gazogenes]SHF24800.1 A/G-specific DNA-adenine glycosylase [Vibrio gazogenes DSM 21264] [Vibrio gazogenes DSM 21264 = NBRC 103151]SJN57025.1 A/G-specific adenine glycosylase [Vibrio gazogenes]
MQMQSPISPQQFQQHLIDWQRAHGRHDLPWQQNPSPYRVLVSEVMLQQTQVVTVIPYFERWMTSFPTIEALASATEDEVMNHWQGLGYYSRARNLRKAAQYIMTHHQGQFPDSLETLLDIPGVGRYTAGAIRSFAYDRYGPIVDGNVKRLFCRFFALDGVPGTSAVDKQLWQLAETFTPETDNRVFAQGLLDIGATICKPKNPDCELCCFQKNCLAFKYDRVQTLPTPKPKKTIPTKAGQFLWVESDHKILLEKRASDGIWGALWCLPQIHLQPEQFGEHMQLKGTFKHTFTHYKLDANVWMIDRLGVMEPQLQWVEKSEVFNLGLPTPIKKFLTRHLEGC